MLFNSWNFIVVFLPVTAIGFFLCGTTHWRLANLWLIAASLTFYASWAANYLPLIIASITFNYLASRLIVHFLYTSPNLSKLTLWIALSTNIGILGFYKYFNFLSISIGASIEPINLALPLGISFFTFTQATFLIDCYRGEVRERNPISYALFVTYFPHLIAGPILHHSEMMPQFYAKNIYRFSADNFAIGLSVFIIGLFKKTVLADGVSIYVDPVFLASNESDNLSLYSAWWGALAYTFQLYFDFSGYCDMAIGLSKMFNVKLPINFDSPYKATSIIDFWRRWHITLSRFLRDYLYISLGGNRKGAVRRYSNLTITMLLGGLWHGASWTYVVWGGLHGAYLLIAHMWRELKLPLIPKALGWVLTFFAVTTAWVFFRSDSIKRSCNIVYAMFGGNGLENVTTPLRGVTLTNDLYAPLGAFGEPLSKLGLGFHEWAYFSGPPVQVLSLVLLAAIVFLLPNTHELMHKYEPALVLNDRPRDNQMQFSMTRPWALIISCIGCMGLLNMNRVSEFLYWQF